VITISQLTPTEHAACRDELPGGSSVGSSEAFQQVWVANGGRPIVFAAYEDDKLAATLAAVEFGHGPLRRVQAMPDGLYADPLVANECLGRSGLILEALLSYLRDNYARVHITDFDGDLPRPSGFDLVEQATIVVPVADPDWRPADRKLGQQIRKAIREERRAVDFDAACHMEPFLMLVAATSERLGREFYSTDFFQRLARAAAEDDRIVWKWFEHDGNPVSSHIFLVHRDVFLHWHAFFDPERSHLQPNKFIPFQVAGGLVDRGIRMLNLGATPGDAPGVEEYKNKWGGRPHHYRTLVSRRGLGKLM